MRVVATAGHVDHGKSALVTALTGMQPDRFAEERERGLTIDLGFVWTTLARGNHTVAFIDVPGHERFVSNMLAGLGGVDLALLVVAADEGWMPQSAEHLEILDLLGVSRGLVAITKADAVDAETLGLAEELVAEELAPTTLAGAEIVAVSAHTGKGLETLTDELGALLDSAPGSPDLGRPRLWVDRSFTVRGAGTVATGTLTGGELAAGQRISVLPEGGRGRVRGLEALKTTVERAQPGSRVAVNLSGVDRSDVPRGGALGHPGQWLAVDAFDAWIRALPGRMVQRKGAWRIHVGSGSCPAEIIPYDQEPVTGEGYARLELARPVPLTAGDRFVLRESGRQATMGGGLVLDPAPPARPRGRKARNARVDALAGYGSALADDDPGALLTAKVGYDGVVAADVAAAAVGLSEQRARQAAARELVTLGDALAGPTAVEEWAAAARAALRTYHEANPVERAAPKDLVLRAVVSAGCPSARADALVDELVGRGDIAAEGRGLRAPEHAVQLDADDVAARQHLLGLLDAEPFTPPGLGEAAQRAGASWALVRELEAVGDLVRLGPDLAVTAAALQSATDWLRDAYQREGALTAARAKDVLATTRKYAVPLLEELDRRGATQRTGDLRELR
jgi:selenocysteine-specific elongation factor